MWAGSPVIDSRGGAKGADAYTVVVGEGGALGAILLSPMYVSVSVTENKNREIRQHAKKEKLRRVCCCEVISLRLVHLLFILILRKRERERE